MSKDYEQGTRPFSRGSPGAGSSFREQQDGFPATQEHPELMKIMLDGSFSPLLLHINYCVVFGLHVPLRHPSVCVCACVRVPASRWCEAGVLLGVQSKESSPPHLLKEIQILIYFLGKEKARPQSTQKKRSM